MMDDPTILTECGRVANKGFVCRLGLGRMSNNTGKCPACFQKINTSLTKHAYEECVVIQAVAKEHPDFLPSEKLSVKKVTVAGKLKLADRVPKHVAQFGVPKFTVSHLRTAQAAALAASKRNPKRAKVAHDPKLHAPKVAATAFLSRMEASLQQPPVVRLPNIDARVAQMAANGLPLPSPEGPISDTGDPGSDSDSVTQTPNPLKEPSPAQTRSKAAAAEEARAAMLSPEAAAIQRQIEELQDKQAGLLAQAAAPDAN